MLPEFLNEQAEYKPGINLPSDVEELRALQSWLKSKESETNRQIRPAWIEIAWALVNLVEQRLQNDQQKTDQYVFETHIVARQVAKQRSERQIPTRFVTDEIKRISNHQLDFLCSVENQVDKLTVIGWYRLSNRRGLGLAVMSKHMALALCNNDDQGNQVKGAVYETERVAQECPPAKLFNYKLVGSIAIVLTLLALYTVNFFYGLNQDKAPIDILSSIKKEQKMFCGVDGLLPHFSLRNDAEQTWWGLDVELCKALGAALDVDVEYVKVSASRFDKRIAALENQDVHILFRNTSHTVTRDLNAKIIFGPIYFYEREYFLDLSPEPIKADVEMREIQGKNICVKPGTSNEQALYHLKQETDFHIITQDNNGDVLSDNVKLLRALRGNKTLCDFVFGNHFILKQLKIDQERRSPGKVLTLRPFEKAGLDPLAPVLLRDYQWQTIVNFSIYALLYADKLGINSYNVDEKYISGSVDEKLFLQGKGMEKIGLSEDWVFRIISEVGNYSEIYYRSIVCAYVACEKLSEIEFYDLMTTIEDSRWPNKVFKANDLKPGVLHTPRF